MHASVIILVLFSHPVAQKQFGPYEFASKLACEAAAPGIVTLNERHYPGVKFGPVKCLSARDDLP